MSKFSKVAAVAEIPPGAKKIVEVDGIEVVVINLDGQFYAVEDVCTHDGGPLGEGKLNGWRLICTTSTARASMSAPAPPPGCRRSTQRRMRCGWKMAMCW